MTFQTIGHWLALGTLGTGLLHAVTTTTPRALDRAPVFADDTSVVTYMVDSVRVIQRINPLTDVVAANVYLLGGSQQLTPATQGIESMLLIASRYGTRSYPDSALRAVWGRTGSWMTSEITNDWTMLGFRGIPGEFDTSWNIVSERLTAPRLQPDAIELARGKMLSVLAQRRATPDAEISFVADSLTFVGHAYSNSPYGTEASIAAIDSAAVASYVRTKISRSRLLVVVAGAVTRAQVEAAVRRTLARLPVGNYTWTAPAPVAAHGASVLLIPRQSATNYVIGVFDGPPVTSDEYPAFRTAVSFLSGMISNAVREKSGYSYAASAGVTERAVVTANVYVSTGKPDTVVRLIQRQVATMLDPDSLPAGFTFSNDKNSLGNLFARSTSSAQVEALAYAQLLQGDYRLADNLPRRMRSVSSSSVRQAARKYFQNFRYVYAGDTTLVKRKSFQKL
jgi:zinc protease